MEALSDSSVTSGCSGVMVSPGFTMTSMTGTSLKSPISGTRTSRRPLGACAGAGGADTAGLTCFRRGARSVDLQRQNGRSCADLVAEFDGKRFDHACARRRHFHRGLVGFQRDERGIRLHALARLHLDLDDRHILEVADVGNADFPQLAHRIALPNLRRAARSLHKSISKRLKTWWCRPGRSVRKPESIGSPGVA